MCLEKRSEIHIVFNLGYSLPNLALKIDFGPQDHAICYQEFSIAFIDVLRFFLEDLLQQGI